ncbi:hypothetical protein ACT4UL_05110 [Bacillus sp. HC-TM]
MDQHEEIEAVEPEASAEQVDPRDEKIANLEAQLAEAQTRERDGILRVKAEMENLRRRTGEYDIDILDVQDNMIKQVKVFPVKPLRESVAE